MLAWLTCFVDNQIVEIDKTETGIIVKQGGTILPPKERDELLKKIGLYDFVMAEHMKLLVKAGIAEPSAEASKPEGSSGGSSEGEVTNTPEQSLRRRGRPAKSQLTAHLVNE